MTNTISETHRGNLLYDEPMSRHTSWRTGGPADVYYRATNTHDLAAFVRQRYNAWVLSKEQNDVNDKGEMQAADKSDVGPCLVWVGLGSNLLVRDGGIRGAVIATHQSLSSIAEVDNYAIDVGAGVPCAKLARRSIRYGFAGAEFFAGIPGTVGGALAMNAGAFGGETWDVVESITTLDIAGNIHERTLNDYRVGYRRVERVGPEQARPSPAPQSSSRHHLPEWFLSARLRLKAGEASHSREKIKTLLARRAATQPIQSFNAGSVFRNPPDGFAAQLIEAAGLKGLRRGGACVSTQHANFIINDDQATSADIEWLIDHVQQRVREHSGVTLEPEVRIVGEA